MPHRRITLVAQAIWDEQRNWSDAAAGRTIVVPSPRYALAMLVSSSADIERVIIDRCQTAEEFLGFLTCIPGDFTGDVLFVRSDESAYLSAQSRGEGRVLARLAPDDLRFYLEIHELVTRSHGGHFPIGATVADVARM